MSIEIHVGTAVRLDVGFGQSYTGLADVGYTMKNTNGTIYKPRSQIGVVEDGVGYYHVDYTFAEQWNGYVEWDSPSVPPPKPRDDILVVAASITPPTPVGGARSTVPDFIGLLQRHGSVVTYHRDDSMVPCPCRTKQGYRNPEWHIQHPAEPVCNEAGMLPQPGTTAEFMVRAFVQPVQSGAVRRLTSEQLLQMYGEIQMDDHIGFFPVEWKGSLLNFYNWGEATEDYIVYNNRKFIAVSTNLIPDPADGNPWHHWEIGLRLLNG